MLSVIYKKKEVQMNRSYNHIKHSVENIVNNIMARLHWQDVKHDANQLDSKQRHAGFDYHEYDVLEFGTTPGRAQSFFRPKSWHP